MLRLFGCFIILLFFAGGCVERKLTVVTNPPGALVYLNDQEIGRTPFTRDFLWYGTYDVAVRKDGYSTVKTAAPIIAPIYEWVPLDLLSELLPIHITDQHTLKYDLQVNLPSTRETEALIKRAQEMQGELESSHKPATEPVTQPATKPSSQPSAQPGR